MKSEWRVTSQCFIGSEKRVYQVYRLRDIHTIDHSGNREHKLQTFYERSEAEKLAAQLNAEEEQNGKAQN